jgi:hypothetical protein
VIAGMIMMMMMMIIIIIIIKSNSSSIYSVEIIKILLNTFIFLSVPSLFHPATVLVTVVFYKCRMRPFYYYNTQKGFDRGVCSCRKY